MSELNESMLEGFRSELQKIAMGSRLHSALGAAGALGGTGAVLGGVIGTGVQGYRGYQQAREQGAGHLQSALLGLGDGVMNGASRGAMIGGGVGAGLGAALGGANPGAGNRLRAALDSRTGAHFGQRQVHALTGWTPEKGIGSIGLGGGGRVGQVQGAAQNYRNAVLHGTDTRGRLGKVVDKVMGRNVQQSAELQLDRALASQRAAQKAEDMGLTSIPGYVQSLAKNPVRTLKAAVNDQWAGRSAAEKAMMIGLPAMGLHSAITQSPERQGGEEGRGRNIGMTLAGTAAGMLLSPLPMTVGGQVGNGLAHLGGAVGARVGRSRLNPPPRQQDVMADGGQVVPAYREMSERAGGAGEGVPA